MDDSAFVLDANVFIEAARRYYAFDLVPVFWESLIEYATAGRIQSIDRVRKELEEGKDELAEWAKRHFSHAFASTDKEDIVRSYGKVINWVNGQVEFCDAAKAEFAHAKNADGWVIAYAHARRCIVVTQEVLAPDAKRKVPIPNVCQAFNVSFIDTFEMLRKLGARWTD